MTAIIARLDLTQIFCDVDDFFQDFQKYQEKYPKLPTDDRQQLSTSRLCVSEVMLRKRAIVESVNDQLKNICQIEHTRHRSLWNFLVNLLSGLVAYTYHPVKPSLDLEIKGLVALPPAMF